MVASGHWIWPGPFGLTLPSRYNKWHVEAHAFSPPDELTHLLEGLNRTDDCLFKTVALMAAQMQRKKVHQAWCMSAALREYI
eukprot:1149573-Pelagomonas_calceolata.AAC.1